MWGRETLAMLVSSSSIKVARVTVIAISQGLIAGLTVSATGTLSGSDNARVLTYQLLVYIVNMYGVQTVYGVNFLLTRCADPELRLNKSYSSCRVTRTIISSFIRSGSFHG